MGGEQQKPHGMGRAATETTQHVNHQSASDILSRLSASLTKLLLAEPSLFSGMKDVRLQLELTIEDRTFTTECGIYLMGSADNSTTVSQAQSSIEFCNCGTTMTNQGRCVYCHKPVDKRKSD